MTAEQIAAGVPLQKDIDMLNSLVSSEGPLASTEAPEGLDLVAVYNLCLGISLTITNDGAGDARIPEALNICCANFYVAIRAAVTEVRDTITADRDAL